MINKGLMDDAPNVGLKDNTRFLCSIQVCVNREQVYHIGHAYVQLPLERWVNSMIWIVRSGDMENGGLAVGGWPCTCRIYMCSRELHGRSQEGMLFLEYVVVEYACMYHDEMFGRGLGEECFNNVVDSLIVSIDLRVTKMLVGAIQQVMETNIILIKMTKVTQ